MPSYTRLWITDSRWKKLVEQFQAVDVMDAKKTFYVFFIFQTIFLFLNVGKVQSDKQVN